MDLNGARSVESLISIASFLLPSGVVWPTRHLTSAATFFLDLSTFSPPAFLPQPPRCLRLLPLVDKSPVKLDMS